jgi:hypothetical protein
MLFLGLLKINYFLNNILTLKINFFIFLLPFLQKIIKFYFNINVYLNFLKILLNENLFNFEEKYILLEFLNLFLIRLVF